MNKLNDEQKKAALEAGKQGMKDAYEKSKTKTGLKWWQRPCPAGPGSRTGAPAR